MLIVLARLKQLMHTVQTMGDISCHFLQSVMCSMSSCKRTHLAVDVYVMLCGAMVITGCTGEAKLSVGPRNV